MYLTGVVSCWCRNADATSAPVRTLLGKRKEKYRRCTGVLTDPKARWASGHDSHVLLAIDFIGDDAAADRAAGVKAIKHFTRLGIENDEITGSLPAKDDIS